MGTDGGHITKVDELIINMDAANSRSYTSGSASCNCLVSSVSGTLEGGTSFTSEYKGGWVFGGSNDYINLGNRTKINPELNSFTTNIFFKIDSNSTSSSIIASKGNGADSDIGWLIYYSNTNNILTVRCNGNNTTSERAAQYTSINKGQVYMVTMVINRTDNTIKGYLNGSNVGWSSGNYVQAFTGNSISGFGSITNSNDFLVGERPQLNLPMFGTIYLFQTYNFALSESQVYRNFRFFGGRYDLSVPPPPPTFFNDYSFDFDGTDDYVDIGLVTALNGASTFSISTWVNADTFSGDKVFFGVATDANNRIFIEFYGLNGHIVVGIGNGSNTYQAFNLGLSTGTWYHVVVVFDGTQTGVDRMTLYIDGVAQTNPQTAWPATTATFTSSTYLGAYDSGLYPFNGKQDETSIWSTALSSSQVSAFYNSGTPTDLTGETGLVAWYRMGDNGIYKSPQWLLPSNENKDKASNYSMSFDGTNDYVSVGDVFDQDGSTAFSISAWVKLDDVTYFQMIVAKMPDASPWNGYSFYTSGTNIKFAISENAGSSNLFVWEKTSVVSAGVWYHMVATYDGSLDVSGMNVYLDGAVLTPTTASNGSTPFDSSSPGNNLQIGARGGGGLPLAGLIDEVNFWNIELTPSNVTSIYNYGIPSDVSGLGISGLAGYWKMGENATFKSTQWLIPNNENKDKASNYSMSFDGTDDYIDAGDNNGYPYIIESKPFSVGCWVKVTDFSPNIYPTLIQLATNTTYSWMMGVTNHPSYLGVIIGSRTGWVRIKTDTPSSTFIGKWVHIVATYNGSDPTIQSNFTIYINGLSSNLSSSNQFAITTQVNRFGAGAGDGTLNLLEGSLSDISLWNTELTSSQVSSFYNSGNPTNLTGESGLVGYWKMGENAIYDNSLTKFTIPNINQPTYYSTKNFEINVSSYITMGDVLDFEMTDTLTISCWAKKPSGSGTILVAKGHTGGDYKGYLLYCRSGNKIAFASVADLSNYIDVYANVAFSYNRWHHFVATYDGSTNASGVKLYQDGVELTTIIDVDTYTSGSVLNSYPFQIGARNGTQNFVGNIDEVTVWDEELTSGNVTSMYNSSIPNNVTDLGISGLVGFWRMGEGSTFSTNWTIPDDSANSNSGVSVNAVEADVKLMVSTEAISVNMDIYDRIGDAPGSSGNTVSYNMDIYDRVGDAPNSENNALSYNMGISGRTTNVPT